MRNKGKATKIAALAASLVMAVSTVTFGATSGTITPDKPAHAEKKWDCNMSVTYNGAGYVTTGSGRQKNSIYFQSESIYIVNLCNGSGNIDKMTTAKNKYYIGDSCSVTPQHNPTGRSNVTISVSDLTYGSGKIVLYNY